MRISFAVALILFFSAIGVAGEKAPAIKYKLEKNIFYHPVGEEKADEYQKKQCRLDVYYPEDQKGFATVVWFHGGGMKGGRKYIPGYLKKKGLAVVCVEYRFYPKIKCPVYLQDAAAGLAWVFKNIERYGGDPDKIFVSGHSAGGYLTSMLGMDKRWLKEQGVDAAKIAGLIPLSGHTITHMTVRQEKGIGSKKPIIDEFAPLYYSRKDTPPILLITGDRNLEMLGRYEENAYFMRMLKVNGNNNVTLYEIQGYGHGMEGPALPIALKWMNKVLESKK